MTLRSQMSKQCVASALCVFSLIVFSAANRGCRALAESTSQTQYEVGLAKVDITPDYPIRLCGFTGRKTESEGIRQHIFARALAIGSGGTPAVLITVDSIGIPAALREEVAKRLQTNRKIPIERVSICSTHCHTTPTLKDVLPTMFGEPLSPDQQTHIDHYTSELTDKVEQVALAALDDLRRADYPAVSARSGSQKIAVPRAGPSTINFPCWLLPRRTVRSAAFISAMHVIACCCATTRSAVTGQNVRQMKLKRRGRVPLRWSRSVAVPTRIPRPTRLRTREKSRDNTAKIYAQK